MNRYQRIRKAIDSRLALIHDSSALPHINVRQYLMNNYGLQFIPAEIGANMAGITPDDYTNQPNSPNSPINLLVRDITTRPAVAENQSMAFTTTNGTGLLTFEIYMARTPGGNQSIEAIYEVADILDTYYAGQQFSGVSMGLSTLDPIGADVDADNIFRFDYTINFIWSLNDTE